ncbi:RNA polymerase sigma factor [Streptomyces sp. NPDC002730]|uniref:RNA polymerase sigma factor n=1 Tax=Streptomyces sp. NPDC002730 TaxID=3364662 RepID=UPI00367BC075
MIHDLNSPAARSPTTDRHPGLPLARVQVRLAAPLPCRRTIRFPWMRTAQPYTACTWGLLGPVDASRTSVSQVPVHHTPGGFRTRSYVAPSPTPVFMECGRLGCSMVDHQDEPPTDAEPVPAALRNPGSAAVVEELYRRHREPVLSHAYTCRHDPRSTEDLTSEAFRAVREARSGCGPTLARRPSLLTVVRRTAAGRAGTARRTGMPSASLSPWARAEPRGKGGCSAGTSCDGSCLLRIELRAGEPGHEMRLGTLIWWGGE